MRNYNCGNYNQCLTQVVRSNGRNDDPAAFDCAGCERVNESVCADPAVEAAGGPRCFGPPCGAYAVNSRNQLYCANGASIWQSGRKSGRRLS